MFIPGQRSFQVDAVYAIVGELQTKDLYGHKVRLPGPYVPLPLVDWCRDNLRNPCAYWFDMKIAYIGFDDDEEATWFTLCNLGEPCHG